VKDDQRLSSKESGADRRENRGSINGQGFTAFLIEGNQKPNAKLTGARVATAKRCPVSASLLNAKLGWCDKHWRVSHNGPCLDD
jgi:hypothetical protein